jgi:hypothetical protein
MTNLLDQLTAALKLSGEGREKLITAMRQAKLTERDPEIVPVTLMLTLREVFEQSRTELARLEHSVRGHVDRQEAVVKKLLDGLQSPARIDQAIRLIDAETVRACKRIEASGQHLEEQFDKLADLVSDARWYRWSIPLAIGFSALVVTVALYFSPGELAREIWAVEVSGFSA